MTPEELRDIDRRIAVAKGEPSKAPLPYATDESLAFRLLREMVEREMVCLGHSGVTGKYLSAASTIQADTLETAIALAWLAVFEKEPVKP